MYTQHPLAEHHRRRQWKPIHAFVVKVQCDDIFFASSFNSRIKPIKVCFVQTNFAHPRSDAWNIICIWKVSGTPSEGAQVIITSGWTCFRVAHTQKLCMGAGRLSLAHFLEKQKTADAYKGVAVVGYADATTRNHVCKAKKINMVEQTNLNLMWLGKFAKHWKFASHLLWWRSDWLTGGGWMRYGYLKKTGRTTARSRFVRRIWLAWFNWYEREIVFF